MNVSGIIKNLIDGSYGPYSKSTLAGQGANAGYATAESTKNGSIFGKDIKYAYNDDKGWSRDSSLAFSREVLKSQDSNGDGTLDINDDYWTNFANQYNNLSGEDRKQILNPALLNEKGELDKQKLFNQFDLNGDGKIDEAENTALMCLQDAVSQNFTGTDFKGTPNDGTLSQDERDMGLDYMLKNPNAKTLLNEYYKGYELDQRQNIFKMPPTVAIETPVVTTNNQTSQSVPSEAPKAPADINKMFLQKSGGMLRNNEIDGITNGLTRLGFNPADIVGKIKSVSINPDGTITIKTDENTIKYNQKSQTTSLTPETNH
ncbi:MAG: hypothetical protein PHC34_09110 [Candidatus Gastranaerophilales bacterium]|nr:hypothetical protein [Candidatus Gastranaerophilales bacterium]